jgi:hypothetical protein
MFEYKTECAPENTADNILVVQAWGTNLQPKGRSTSYHSMEAPHIWWQGPEFRSK